MWIITHPACLAHDTGQGHPERPERLRTILKALEADEFDALHWVDAERASDDELARAHDPDYVDRILGGMPQTGYRAIDGDTIVCNASGEAALRAAGAVRQAVDAVFADQADRVFCAVRPPGHHAEADRAMGFCLFNNIVVGALHARAVHSAQRVAIVDFDVHHGNGTEAILNGREGFFYGSTHQSPLFPGTGNRRDNRRGVLCNVPLAAGTGSDAFRGHFHNEIVHEVMAFDPDLIMISAGFDAHVRDPLAALSLTEEDFAWATSELVSAAEYCCGGRIISTLEGGYDLEALAASAAAHVKALMG